MKFRFHNGMSKTNRAKYYRKSSQARPSFVLNQGWAIGNYYLSHTPTPHKAFCQRIFALFKGFGKYLTKQYILKEDFRYIKFGEHEELRSAAG